MIFASQVLSIRVVTLFMVWSSLHQADYVQCGEAWAPSCGPTVSRGTASSHRFSMGSSQ